jgi:alkylation response protein AidB-like acyl-CoA dehydrogenase
VDFDLSREQKDIQRAARDFAVGEFTDVARDYDLHETVPMEILNKARRLGFIGIFISEAYGGPGFGFLEQALVLEKFWKVDPGISQELCSVTFGAEELLLYGTEDQKKKFLPPIFEGKAIMGFAITEPDAGKAIPISPVLNLSPVLLRPRGPPFSIHASRFFPPGSSENRSPIGTLLEL